MIPESDGPISLSLFPRSVSPGRGYLSQRGSHVASVFADSGWTQRWARCKRRASRVPNRWFVESDTNHISTGAAGISTVSGLFGGIPYRMHHSRTRRNDLSEAYSHPLPSNSSFICGANTGSGSQRSVTIRIFLSGSRRREIPPLSKPSWWKCVVA